MKKLFSILLIALLPILGNAQQESSLGWMFINTNTIDADKQLHFVGGVWAGVSGYTIAYRANGYKRGNAKLWGVLTSVVLGTLKEVNDTNTTGFDTADLGYTIAGGVVATYTFDFLVGRAKRRNKKKQNAIAYVNNLYD